MWSSCLPRSRVSRTGCGCMKRRRRSVLTGRIGLGPNLTPNILLDFVNAEGNIMVAMSSTTPTSTSIVSLLSELDITLPIERTGTVVDHFHYDSTSSPDEHRVLVLDAPGPIRPDVKNYFEKPGSVLAVPNAAGHVLGNSQLLTPILRAPATAYSYNPAEQFDVIEADELFAAGSQIALVSAAQARNNARVTLLGSAEMLQDKWFGAKVTKAGSKAVAADNRAFAKTLSAWAFKEIGILRVNGVEHHLKDDAEINPGLYRIKNDVVSAINLCG